MATIVSDAISAKLREEEAGIVSLAQVVQKKREELKAAEEALELAEVNFEWNRLQAYAAADEEAITFASALDEAITAFERSLCPPSDIEGGAATTAPATSSSGAAADYQETDDYGDLSSVESTLDDILEDISVYRRTNVDKNLERSVAMLLLVSLKFQRLTLGADGVAALLASSALPSAAVAHRGHVVECSEYDEMKQSLVDEWAETLTDLESVGEDSALMLRMLRTKLGSPFDDIANGRQ